MALTVAQAARMLEVFLPKFNAHHGTDFTFDEKATNENERAPGSNRDPSIDYICTGPGGERLLLQHTEAWCDADAERLWPRNVKWIRQSLQREVAKMPGAPYILGLGIRQAPRTPQEAGEIVAALGGEVRDRIPLLSAGQPVVWRPAEGVRAFVGEVTLERPGEPDTRGMSPDYADTLRRMIRASLARSPWQPGESRIIATDYSSRGDAVGERAVISLERKNVRYVGSGKDLVLLIDYRVTGYDVEDLPAIAQAIENVSADFKDVWVVSEWSMEGGHAHRVFAFAA